MNSNDVCSLRRYADRREQTLLSVTVSPEILFAQLFGADSVYSQNEIPSRKSVGSKLDQSLVKDPTNSFLGDRTFSS